MMKNILSWIEEKSLRWKLAITIDFLLEQRRKLDRKNPELVESVLSRRILRIEARLRMIKVERMSGKHFKITYPKDKV